MSLSLVGRKLGRLTNPNSEVTTWTYDNANQLTVEQRSGDEQALELAGKLARFVMKLRFWGHPADPPLVAGDERGHIDSHFHARAIALRGLLEYGIVARDMGVCDFVRSSYEYLRSWGINEIGFVPCWPKMGRNTMEACLFGDLVALTAKMSGAGLGDYWEDADRIIRNHLVEAQLVDRELAERIMESSPESSPEQCRDVYAA